MSIDKKRDDYLLSLDEWDLVSDAAAGSSAVKRGGAKYLPMLNETDTSKENLAINKAYSQRAIYYNATKRTLDTLMGQVFRKPVIVDLKGRTAALESNANGQGLKLQQQIQKACRQNLLIGRIGIYVDYPSLDRPASLADNITATINTIDARSVHNWRTAMINGQSKLTAVVIFETVEEGDDLDPDIIKQYRALRLIDGVYVVQLWREDENGEWAIYSEVAPRDSKGATWNEIPFIFCGSVNNDPDIDASPMIDIAILNIGHYVNSANHEDSTHMVNQPQPWISGLTEEWRDSIVNQGVYLGSRTVLTLPEGGKFGIAQSAETTSASEAMTKKESQMISIGARLIVKGEAVKTVDQARNENEAQHSVLSLVVENVEDAYNKALGWVGRYMGDEGGTVTINRDFLEAPLDAAMIQALTGAWSGGLLPDSDAWDTFRKAGIIDPNKTDDQIREETTTVDLNLDD